MKGINLQLKKLFVSMAALILVMSIVLPAGVVRADDPAPPPASLEVSILKQKAINDGDTEFTLTLSNDKWKNGFSKEELIAALSAADQTDQWNLIKDSITAANIATPTDVQVKISIPKNEGYKLTKDQTINLAIPGTLLESDTALSKSFKIIAQPRITISGTAVNIKPIDFIKGGKTIVLTVLNAEWAGDIASDDTKKGKLIDAFTWGEASSDTDIHSIVKGNAAVTRTSNHAVTITLPPVADELIGEVVKLDSAKLIDAGAGLLTVTPPSTNDDFLKEEATAITLASADQPKITVVPNGKVTNFDVLRGDRKITLKLSNSVWAKELTGKEVTFTDGDKDAPAIITGEITEQKNDTEIEVQLTDKDSAAKIRGMQEDTKFKLAVPAETIKYNKDEVTLENALTVVPVKVERSGTAKEVLDPQEVIKGGKTVILSLKNADFSAAADVTFDDIFGQGNPWTNESAEKFITKGKNQITVKLPPVSALDSTANLTISVPYKWVEGVPGDLAASGERFSAGEIAIEAPAKVTVSPASLAETDIRLGNSKTIQLTLDRGEWDPAVETVKSKKSALMKGFTTTDQTKEWTLAVNAIVEQADFKISGVMENGKNVNRVLTITLKGAQGYAIARPQAINVKVPKSVLIDYKYDIESDSLLTINIPDISNPASFTDSLKNLPEMIGQDDVNQFRVIVPKRNIITVTTNVLKVGEQTLTTVEVETSDKVTGILVKQSEEDSGKEYQSPGNGQFVMVFNDMPAGAQIELVALEGSTELESVHQKIASGKKVNSKVPKTPLDGSYSLYTILTDKSLLTNILKFYSLDDLTIGKVN